jgi:hypothetical protein
MDNLIFFIVGMFLGAIAHYFASRVPDDVITVAGELEKSSQYKMVENVDESVKTTHRPPTLPAQTWSPK